MQSKLSNNFRIFLSAVLTPPSAFKLGYYSRSVDK